MTQSAYGVASDLRWPRSKRVSWPAQLDVDGPAFHALCLDRMDAVNAERGPAAEDYSSFLKGCMYDIADRCLLKFARRT